MKKPIILCVDDEKTVLSSLKTELRESLGDKYVIEIAESGEEALEIVGEMLDDDDEIALVISDYIMPDMKGDEVLKRIHEISPKTLKIMLTGHASTEGITNAVNFAGLYRYIGKPWEQGDFELTITQALKSYSQDRQIEEQHKQIRESEKKYRSIFENAVEGIFQSIPGAGYLSVNPAYAKILGYDSPQEVLSSITDIGKQLYVNPGEREELVRIIREKGKAEGFEARLYRKDRSIMWVSVYARNVSDNQGNLLYYEGSFIDITDRKKAELELKKYQEHLEEMVEKRTAELAAVLAETRIAREIAEKANKKITDSLNYAKMIQRSLLANLDVVKTYIPNSFFIWEPRDIVGGDIFFTEKLEDGFIVAVADCTGHGVPGAFMTMIAVSALRRIIKDEGCRDPAEILRRLNVIVKTTLHQDKAYAVSDDGMDAGIVRMENVSIESHASGFQYSDLIFAGAKIPLYYVCSGELAVIKGDRESIGYRRSDVNFCFTNHRVHIEKGMNFYMASDGFTDQTGGGEKRRRFGTARFRHLLKEISGEPFEKQRSMLIQVVEEHRGDNDRQDDMTVAGFGF